MVTQPWSLMEDLESRLLLAGTVWLNLQLDEDANTFQLYADTSAGDNFGLSAFDIIMTDIATAQVVAPRGVDPVSEATYGFAIHAQAPAGVGKTELLGGQDILQPETVIFGFGQTAGSFPAGYLGVVGSPWDAHVLLATGTYLEGDTPTIDIGISSASVWIAQDPLDAEFATQVLPVSQFILDRIDGIWIDRAVLYDAPPAMSYLAISPEELSTLHAFYFDVDLDPALQVDTISFTPPGGSSYALSLLSEPGDPVLEYGYELLGDAPADLAAFVDGTYTLAVTLDNGAFAETTIEYTGLTAPAQEPELVTPELGDWGLATNLTVQWDPVTDPNVNAVWVWLTDVATDEVIDSASLASAATTWQPEGLAADAVYVVTVMFANVADSAPLVEPPWSISKYTSTGAVFNTATANLLADIDEIFIERGIFHDATGGSPSHSFELGLESATGDWLEHAIVQSPSGAWYAMDWTDQTPDGFERSYAIDSTDPDDLADFTDGTYTLWLDLGGNVYATTEVAFRDPDTQAALDQPVQAPELLTPQPSAIDVPADTSFAWTAVSDPSVTDIALYAWQPTAEDDEIAAILASTATGHDPDGELSYGAEYGWEVDFVNARTGQNAHDVDFRISKLRAAYASFDTVAPAVDLAGHLGVSGLPASIVEEQPLTGTLAVVVTNVGQIAAGPAQRITVEVIARNEDTLAATTLATLANQSIASLAVGGSRTIAVPVNFTAGLEPGEYTLEALLVAGDLDEPDTDNNRLTEDAGGDPIALEVEQAFEDYTASIGAATTLPRVVVSGAGTLLRVPVVLANSGNTAVPPNRTIDVALVARPAGAVDDSQDVLLKTLSNQLIGRLAVNGVRTFYLTGYLPIGLASGEYLLIGQVDSTGEINEFEEDNNEAAAVRSLDVIKGWVDITSSFSSVLLPPAVDADVAVLAKRVTVMVANQGTVPLPLGQTVTVTLIADGAEDVALAGPVTGYVSRLAAGARRAVILTVNLPEGVDEGSYQLRAIVTPNAVAGVPLTEEHDDNNDATLNALGRTVPLVSDSDSFIDVTGYLGRSTLRAAVASGSPFTGLVQAVLSNAGNTALPPGLVVDVVLRARDTGDDSLVPLDTYYNYSLSLLAPGATRIVSFAINPLNLPAGLEQGQYELEAAVETVTGESDTDNNTITANAAGAPIAILADDAHVDLRGTIRALPALPARTLISGDGSRITVPVVVTNAGNAPVGAGETIDIIIAARPVGAVDDTQDVPLTTATSLADRPIGLLGPNLSRTFTATATLPVVGLATDDYRIVAKIDTSNDVEELLAGQDLEGNNSALSSSLLHVARGFRDLAGTFALSLLPRQISAGQRLVSSIRVNVTNWGRISLPLGQLVNVSLVARPAGGGDDIVLGGATNQSVSLLRSGLSRLVTISVNHPTGLPALTAGTYTLVAIISPTPPGSLTEEHGDNNEATLTALGIAPTLTVV